MGEVILLFPLETISHLTVRTTVPTDSSDMIDWGHFVKVS